MSAFAGRGRGGGGGRIPLGAHVPLCASPCHVGLTLLPALCHNLFLRLPNKASAPSAADERSPKVPYLNIPQNPLQQTRGRLLWCPRPAQQPPASSRTAHGPLPLYMLWVTSCSLGPDGVSRTPLARSSCASVQVSEPPEFRLPLVGARQSAAVFQNTVATKRIQQNLE